MKQTDRGRETLQRILGLPVALAIGIGTMVGMVFFIFPGIAIGYTGPAAMVSFAIAGVIALLVALSTAELSTAMPESGGAYYFVSRALGSGSVFVITLSMLSQFLLLRQLYLTRS